MVNLGSIYNDFKFFCFSRRFGLEVTNTLGTATVLGLNLTGSAFGLLFVRSGFVGFVATL